MWDDDTRLMYPCTACSLSARSNFPNFLFEQYADISLALDFVCLIHKNRVSRAPHVAGQGGAQRQEKCSWHPMHSHNPSFTSPLCQHGEHLGIHIIALANAVSMFVKHVDSSPLHQRSEHEQPQGMSNSCSELDPLCSFAQG